MMLKNVLIRVMFLITLMKLGLQLHMKYGVYLTDTKFSWQLSV